MAIRNVREDGGAKTESSVTILWDTDEMATTALLMKPSAGACDSKDGMTEQPANGEVGLTHSYVLDNLAQGSYCVHPKSMDRNNVDLDCGDTTCFLTVSPSAPPPPTVIEVFTLDAVPAQFPKSTPTEVTATATTNSGQAVPNKEVVFSLDHGNSPPQNHGQFWPSTATTDANGKAKVSFTAARTGTIHLKAEADNKVARKSVQATN